MQDINSNTVNIAILQLKTINMATLSLYTQYLRRFKYQGIAILLSLTLSTLPTYLCYFISLLSFRTYFR